MEADSLCRVGSLPLTKNERLTRLSSLGFDVHARCADAVLRDEPQPDDDSEWLAGRVRPARAVQRLLRVAPLTSGYA